MVPFSFVTVVVRMIGSQAVKGAIQFWSITAFENDDQMAYFFEKAKGISI